MPKLETPYAFSNNKSLSRDQIRTNIEDFASKLIENKDHCRNVNNKRNTACQCITKLQNEDVFEKLINKLVKYESNDTNGRKLFLHGVLTHGNLRKEELRRGEKRVAIYALTGVEDQDGETVLVCNNTLRALFFVGKKQWKQLQEDAMLPEPKATENYQNNVNKVTACTQRVIDFLFEFAKTEGEMHATRFIRMETRIGVRDSDLDLIHLPSYYTKRQLYETFCYQSGWEIKSFSDGSYPPLDQFPLRKNDDNENGQELALWPEGSEPLSVCSWHTFLRIWKQYLPNLKIKPPSLDTCNLCDEYAKYMKMKSNSQMNNLPTFLSNDPLLCPETNEVSLLHKGFGDLGETRENVVMLAAKHVNAARSQKALAQIKYEAAEQSIDFVDPDKKVITLVMDYCQNLDLPHLGGEQPGDTYYFSPVWLYCLGIVDVSEDQLYAYIYEESAAKKGANNVASILMYHVITFVLDNFRYSAGINELNIVMDNCGGQNKNGTVLKMAAYFVERGWFKSVNMIFLVKGHTKNDCDRMFNLLKMKWHKSNVFTFKDALEILGTVDNVMTIDASNIHIDYTALFDRWYKQPVSGTIQKNHLFSFSEDTIKDCVMTTKRSFNAAVTSTQSIKKVDDKIPDHVRKLDILFTRKMIFLPKPGLAPIKQVHLYTKWRSVVPHPYKDILCPLPTNDIIRMVLKKQGRKKVVNDTPASNVNNTTTTNSQQPTRKQPARRTRPKKHETRTVVVEGEKVDANPDEIASDDQDSDYVDRNYDPSPLEILEEHRRSERIRGKTFLPKKPEAPVTKDEKVERDNQVSKLKEKEKEQRKKVLQKRITTRNMKRLEREKKEPLAKRLRSRQKDTYYDSVSKLI